MRWFRNKRLHRHASTVLACLCLSATTQLLFVGWASLLADSEIIRGVPMGVLVNERGEADSSSAQWVCQVGMVSPTSPATGRFSIIFDSGLGRWAVVRVAKQQPVSWHGMPTVPIQHDWIPRWSTDLSTTPPTPQDAERNRTITDLAFGWPYPALLLTTVVLWNPVDIKVRGAIEVFSMSDAARLASRNAGNGYGPLGLYPTRVIWSGMVLNIIIGACVWAMPFMLTTAVRSVRGRRRVQRGLCAKCGYGPWTGESVCPECGAAAGQRGGRRPS